MQIGLKIGLIALMLWLGLSLQAVSWARPVIVSAAPFIEQITPSRSGIDPIDIPSEKVNQFVQSYLQVVDLIERREGELQGAETDSESHRIAQDIEKEAVTIIEAAGLTRQEYVQLLGLANNDPEFGERIAMQLQESMS